MLNPFKETKRGNRGKKLEQLFRDTIKYYEEKKIILKNIWDKPKKYLAETKNLVGDFWFITNNHFYLLECKEVGEGEKFYLNRLRCHQKNNLIVVDSAYVGKAYLVIWFKNRPENVYFYSGFSLANNLNYRKYIVPSDCSKVYDIFTATIDGKRKKVIKIF